MSKQHESEVNQAALLRLIVRPERSLIRPSACRRHILLTVTVGRPVGAHARQPVRLAIVLDRSGSMAGDRIAVAKAATLALLDRLSAADEVAIVVFDDQIDVVQSRAPVTPLLRLKAAAALQTIEARASTALHQGWLTGCLEVAADTPPAMSARLAHTFLLTDGQANVGLTDAELLAGQAAGVRRDAGVGTSTFGIGIDYNEALLGPLAVGGGGQFHHLPGTASIAPTFDNALAELQAAVALQARLEVRAEPAVSIDPISAYPIQSDASGAWSIGLGDLVAGDERQVVVRAAFPDDTTGETRTVQARLVWQADGQACQSPWQAVTFTVASHAACDAEARDPAVMHWVGLHHAARAEREAVRLLNEGRDRAAADVLTTARERIANYAGTDAALHDAVRSLAAPPPPAARKERYFQSQTASRGQRDLRRPPS